MALWSRLWLYHVGFGISDHVRRFCRFFTYFLKHWTKYRVVFKKDGPSGDDTQEYWNSQAEWFDWKEKLAIKWRFESDWHMEWCAWRFRPDEKKDLDILEAIFDEEEEKEEDPRYDLRWEEFIVQIEYYAHGFGGKYAPIYEAYRDITEQRPLTIQERVAFFWSLLPAVLTIGPLALIMYISPRLELLFHRCTPFENEGGMQRNMEVLFWVHLWTFFGYCCINYQATNFTNDMWFPPPRDQ